MHARTLKPAALVRIATALLGVVAIINLQQATAFAQQPVSSIAISPPSYELSANPGDTITNTIRIDNLVDQDLEITVEARNFTALGEEGRVNLTEEDSTYSLAKWTSVTPRSGNVPAKESKEFEYTIKVPSNAEPGGRFGSIVFKTTAKPLQGQSGVAVGQEIGSLLFLKIAGDVREKVTIASFAAADGINQYKPVNFDVRVKNTGNVHTRPTGTVTVTNMFGKKVATMDITSRNVLPDAVRKMEARWQDGNKFIFGRYTATASVTYGNNGQVVTSSTTFWGLPYTIMLVVLGVLLLLGIGIYRGRKRLRLALRALSGKS